MNKIDPSKATIIAALIALTGVLIPVIINLGKESQRGQCPNDYYEYVLKQDEELRYIAKRNGKSLDDWKKIINRSDGKPYNADQAPKLQVGDIVCLPPGWK